MLPSAKAGSVLADDGRARPVAQGRWSITSQKSLESVVASVEANVGKPIMTDVGARIARRKRLRKSKTLLAADGDKR
jgi:hypothetical protein